MRITIITPAFNSEDTIEKTILSVIRQKKNIFQYIIIDGGSTDRTLEILTKYTEHIDCIVSEKDKGIADAYNKGIKLATGDFIGIVAADDQLINNSIKKIINCYDDSSDVLCGNIIDYNGVRYRRRFSDLNLSSLLKGTSLAHPATFITREAYQKYGVYSLNYKCAIDRELFLRFYRAGAKFQVVNIDISLFASGDGISTLNPCKVAFPEDCKISISYGMPKYKAESYLLLSKTRFHFQKVIKSMLGFIGLDKPFNTLMVKKGKFLSDNQIKKLDLL